MSVVCLSQWYYKQYLCAALLHQITHFSANYKLLAVFLANQNQVYGYMVNDIADVAQDTPFEVV